MAFGGDGLGGGSMAPSLELVPLLVEVEVDEGGLVAEEDIGGTVEGGSFGEFVDPLLDDLRMIRALGGMVMA